MSSVKPLDKETILKSIEKTGAVVVAEEHNKVNGVNSLISAIIGQNINKFIPQESVAIEDRFGQSGTLDQLLVEYGLNTENIIEKTKLALKRKRFNVS